MTGVVVLVFAAAGALVPLFVETVVAPLTAGSSYTLAESVYSILLILGYGSVLLPVALYGWVHAAVRDLRGRWWISVGGLILGFQVMFVDLDGATDALLWLAFVALGVAVTVERVTTRRSVTRTHRSDDIPRMDRYRAAIVVIGLLVLSGMVWAVSSPPPKPALQTMEQEADLDEDLPISPKEADVPSMQTIYREQKKPDVCHYRLS